jgi:predicted DCC family thiol-disulfide oxidoreductase YuxK
MSVGEQGPRRAAAGEAGAADVAESELDCAIMLFDGVCNLCNASVNFIIDHDPRNYFRFAALQSDVAAPYLARCDLPRDFLAGVVLVEGGRCFTRSTAALRIVRRLGGLWPLLYVLVAVPRPLRDAAYGWLIARRYRWFGKRDSCRVPTPELRGRFLEP